MANITTGKTLHELQSGSITDSDLLLFGDVSEPRIAKTVSVAELRVAFGAFINSGDGVVNLALAVDAWIVEGIVGGWKVSIQSATTGAVAYLVHFYNEATDQWAILGGIVETRGELGAAAGPLTREFMVPVASADEVAPRSYRRFKVQAFSAIEEGELSAEKTAWSLVKLPPDFVPAAPVIVEDAEFPYTATRPITNGFAHIIVMRVNAATGEAEYVQRYEMQRKRLEIRPGVDGPWTDLPKHEIVPQPNKPSPRALVYYDESSGAVPGSNVLYRVRAVASNSVVSAWSNTLSYTVEDDGEAPDVPVLTVTPVHLGLEVVFAEPTQGGLPCPDWRYWTLQVSKNSGAFAAVDGVAGRIEKHNYRLSVADADLASTFQFKAKATDWSVPANSSEFCTPTTAASALRVTESSVGQTFSQKLSQIATNTSSISSHSTLISQNAEAITLKASQTDLDTLSGRVTSAEAAIVVNAETRSASRPVKAALTRLAMKHCPAKSMCSGGSEPGGQGGRLHDQQLRGRGERIAASGSEYPADRRHGDRQQPDDPVRQRQWLYQTLQRAGASTGRQWSSGKGAGWSDR